MLPPVCAAAKAGKFLKKLHNRIALHVEGEPASSSASSFQHAERPQLGEVPAFFNTLHPVERSSGRPRSMRKRLPWLRSPLARCTQHFCAGFMQAPALGGNSSTHGSQHGEAEAEHQGHGNITVRLYLHRVMLTWWLACRATVLQVCRPAVLQPIALSG